MLNELRQDQRIVPLGILKNMEVTLLTLFTGVMYTSLSVVCVCTFLSPVRTPSPSLDVLQAFVYYYHTSVIFVKFLSEFRLISLVCLFTALWN